MNKSEGFKPISKLNKASPELNPSQSHKLFSEMSPDRKREFLVFAKREHNEEDLVAMYGLSPEDIAEFFPHQISPTHSNELPIPVVADPPVARPVESRVSGTHVELTPENTHTVTFDDLAHPESRDSKFRMPHELRRIIKSVCSLADRYHKPYVQINFSNGTRIYTYKKIRGDYEFSVVDHPDVVDDFS